MRLGSAHNGKEGISLLRKLVFVALIALILVLLSVSPAE
jgi:hypothetical protein